MKSYRRKPRGKKTRKQKRTYKRRGGMNTTATNATVNKEANVKEKNAANVKGTTAANATGNKEANVKEKNSANATGNKEAKVNGKGINTVESSNATVSELSE
jgi:hypothetical protein